MSLAFHGKILADLLLASHEQSVWNCLDVQAVHRLHQRTDRSRLVRIAGSDDAAGLLQRTCAQPELAGIGVDMATLWKRRSIPVCRWRIDRNWPKNIQNRRTTLLDLIRVAGRLSGVALQAPGTLDDQIDRRQVSDHDVHIKIQALLQYLRTDEHFAGTASPPRMFAKAVKDVSLNIQTVVQGIAAVKQQKVIRRYSASQLPSGLSRVIYRIANPGDTMAFLRPCVDQCQNMSDLV